ncbi:type II toxin-antitoxin system VapC family toxin, partial [Thermococcus sp. GR7]
ALHQKAESILRKVESGEMALHEPLVMLVEVATVVSRLSSSETLSKAAVQFLIQHSSFYSDIYLLDEAIELGIQTKMSGFDVLFLACAKVCKAVLVTDDLKMYEKAREIGIKSQLLRI